MLNSNSNASLSAVSFFLECAVTAFMLKKFNAFLNTLKQLFKFYLNFSCQEKTKCLSVLYSIKFVSNIVFSEYLCIIGTGFAITDIFLLNFLKSFDLMFVHLVLYSGFISNLIRVLRSATLWSKFITSSYITLYSSSYQERNNTTDTKFQVSKYL